LIPCRFWWSWKMMILAAEGWVPTMSSCRCNCKVCTFAHFFRKFLRSFWFPFAQRCLLVQVTAHKGGFEVAS
jgi:hypothetical protein